MKRSVVFEGWRTPSDFKSDGCTMAPDRWLTLKGWVHLGDACVLHDFLRNYALTSVKEADAIFRRHLISLGAPLYMAWLYWIMVKKARPYFTRTFILPYKWEEYRTPKGKE